MTEENGAQPAGGQVFSIEKIYLKDASLEVPNAPGIFLEPQQPAIEVQVTTRGVQLGGTLYEAILTVTLTARAAEKTVFLVEASQAAIFQIDGFSPEEVQGLLGIGCPNAIFPYVRETIANLVNRAGFPTINLAPVNFEQLFRQQLAQAAAAQVAAPSPGTVN